MNLISLLHGDELNRTGSCTAWQQDEPLIPTSTGLFMPTTGTSSLALSYKGRRTRPARLDGDWKAHRWSVSSSDATRSAEKSFCVDGIYRKPP